MRWGPLRRRVRPNAAPGAAAFEEVVLPHLDAAYNFARWLVGDPTLAEDVVQDATVRALRYFNSFRGDNARAWLLQIVRNAAHEARAKQQLHQAQSLDCDPEHEDTIAALAIADLSDNPETALGREEDRETLNRALQRLPADLRECLVLRELEELSYKEIAHITDVPVGTVMSRLWRARQALTPAPAEGASR